jgi:acyl carrier protein
MDDLTTRAAPVAARGQHDVFLQLKEILAELLGADVAEIVGIREDSSFVADLEMDSIQIVAFAERVNAMYDNVNFIGWLSKMPIFKMARLTVGAVAGYIAKDL